MTNCNPKPIRFANCKGRLVEAGFSGGDITSDGGAVLLRAADRMLGLTDSAARALGGPRRQASCLHSLPTMVRPRGFGGGVGFVDGRNLCSGHCRGPGGISSAVALATAALLDTWAAFSETRALWGAISRWMRRDRAPGAGFSRKGRSGSGDEWALCHYPRRLRRVSGVKLPPEAVAGEGVVTEGRSGIQASGGKGSAKDVRSAAFVTRC